VLGVNPESFKLEQHQWWVQYFRDNPKAIRKFLGNPKLAFRRFSEVFSSGDRD
jgi:hypothetical protein